MDNLAGRARQDGGLTPLEDWLRDIVQPAFVHQLEWMWMLLSHDFAAQWDGHDLRIPGPETSPTSSIVPTYAEERHADAPQLTMLATCNVLSLKGTRGTETSMVGIAGQASTTEG